MSPFEGDTKKTKGDIKKITGCYRKSKVATEDCLKLILSSVKILGLSHHWIVLRGS
jgi:hypothetical protein